MTTDAITAAVAAMQSDGTPLGNLKAWLTMHAAVAAATRTGDLKGEPPWRYKCVEDLVLQAGTVYTPRPCPPQYPQGKLKECYTNSFMAAAMREDLRYVEGYGFNDLGIPMAHAFNIDADDQVVDLTWRWQDTDPDAHFHVSKGVLMGLVIPQGLLWVVHNHRKYMGVLDDWEHDYPALRHEWNPQSLRAHYDLLPQKPRRQRKSGGKRSERATA